MRTSENITDIALALSNMQGKMSSVRIDKDNPFFKSKYASLDSILSTLREPMYSEGLSVVQDAILLQEGVSVTTRVFHKSGQWIEFGPLVMNAAKKDAQGIGSAITYAKRYALSAALSISCEEDDDGNKATRLYELEKNEENAEKRRIEHEKKAFEANKKKQEEIKTREEETIKKNEEQAKSEAETWYNGVMKNNDPDLVKAYFNALNERTGVTIERLKIRLSKTPDDFKQKFKQWCITYLEEQAIQDLNNIPF